MGDLTETDNLIAMSFRVQSLIGTLGWLKVVRLSLDQYRDGYAYSRYLLGVLTETHNLLAMYFRVQSLIGTLGWLKVVRLCLYP